MNKNGFGEANVHFLLTNSFCVFIQHAHVFMHMIEIEGIPEVILKVSAAESARVYRNRS